jgi:hypothetical protein
MPTNYFKCNNCGFLSDKIYHKIDQIVLCKMCDSGMSKIYKNINTSLLVPEQKNESIQSCLENNKKELKKIKGE